MGGAAASRARATLWAAVSSALRDDRDAGPLPREELDAIPGAAALLGGDGGLCDAAEALAELLGGASADRLREDRAQVFGHAVRGPCPPYETEYGTDHFLGRSRRLADLGAMYGTFGLRVGRAAHEREDHVAVETEFLAFLCLKRAVAAERGPAGAADLCRDAERIFVAEHLGSFLPALAARVALRDPEGVPAAALRLADGLLREHALELGVTTGSPHLALREVAVPEAEMAITCGDGDPLSAAAGGAVCGPGEFEV